MKDMKEAELRELQKCLDEAKKSAEIILKKSFTIPPDMDVEHCVRIHIIPGHRIGFTQKQAYLERLGDLYSEGYLTQEEYDSRVEWINSSQTQEQADLVFTDLKNAPLTVSKPAVPVSSRSSKTERAKMVFFALTVLAGLFLMGIPHLIWFGLGVLVFGFSFAFYQAHQETKRRRK